MNYVIGHMWNNTFVPGFKIDPLLDAISWKRKNEEAYLQCVEWARDDIDHHARPSIKLYFELLRRPWMAEKLGMVRSDKQFVLNNNLHSQVARLINREFPDIHFPIRKAKSDSYR